MISIIFIVLLYFSFEPEQESDFNKNHPERKDDEVYITNSDQDDYHEIGWKTKRHGVIAYDIHGKKFSEFPKTFPVFVKISEIRSAENGEEILKILLPS